MSARARRRPSWLTLGFLLLLVTPIMGGPAALAQGPEPSGSELREAYPLDEGTPPEADSGARPTPAGTEGGSTRTTATPSSPDDGSTVPIVIAAGLALLAFGVGFGIPLARARSRPAGGEAAADAAGSRPPPSRRFKPSSRSGDRSKPTAPRT